MAGCINQPDRCVMSLFSTCVHFVATHLDMVEDFIGFPSQVGEKIFQAALDTDQFADTCHLVKFVSLFADAFGEELLWQLNVSGQHLGLNFYIDSIVQFHDIVQLDVSHCGLGDDHELLTNLTQLHRLEVLLLNNNAISDTGVQRMTTPYRMFQRGPSQLNYLSLADNDDLTSTCLKYLMPFMKLSSVEVTGCHKVKVGDQRGWVVTQVDNIQRVKVVTEGWASQLIKQWMMVSRQRAQKKPKPMSTFYRRHKQETTAMTDDTKYIEPSNRDGQQFLIATKVVNHLTPKTAMSNEVGDKKPCTESRKARPLENTEVNCRVPNDSSVIYAKEINELMILYQSGQSESNQKHQGNLTQCLDNVVHVESATNTPVVTGQTNTCNGRGRSMPYKIVRQPGGKIIRESNTLSETTKSKSSKQQSLKSFLNTRHLGDQDLPLMTSFGSGVSQKNDIGKENSSTKHPRSLCSGAVPCKTDKGSIDVSTASKSQLQNNAASNTSPGVGKSCNVITHVVRNNVITPVVKNNTITPVVENDVITPVDKKGTDRRYLKATESGQVNKQVVPHKRKRIKLVNNPAERCNVTSTSHDSTSDCKTVLKERTPEGYVEDKTTTQKRVKRLKTGSLLSALDSYT